MLDWRTLKIGDTIWYVNTTAWYDDPNSPRRSEFLELWKGTVLKIDQTAVRPVDCHWDRIGGEADWVKPEWSWGVWCTPGIETKEETHYEAANLFRTAEEAIESYLSNPRKKLIEQAARLKQEN